MTAPELLRAAADAIRDTGTPLHTTVAAWLDDTAHDADTHRAVWELAGQDVEWLTEYRYRWALTVARAALTEAPV
ncbi:MAG: hypothetical protein ACRDTZ_01075 [Pseudonocardiaceae bacterium]